MNRKALLTVVALLASAGAFAQGAARVQSASGVLSVERPGGGSALLSTGAQVNPGDVLRTERDSSARLRFNDGTEVALRPNTHLSIDGFQYEEQKPAADNFALRLLKGGMRTVTGLLGKRTPEKFGVRVSTATVGIRGTDFVVRLCEEECAAENAVPPPTGPAADAVVARVVVLGGALVAVAPGAAPRVVDLDGAVFANEVLTLSDDGIAVLVFRDDTRITLEPGAVLSVGRYEYDAKKPAQGIAELHLRGGGVQVSTGRIAKVRPDQFRFIAADAPVHVRGTVIRAAVARAQGSDGQSQRAANDAASRRSGTARSQDGPIQVSGSLGRDADSARIARDAGAARDVALKTVFLHPEIGVWEGAVEIAGPGGLQIIRRGEAAFFGQPPSGEGRLPTFLANAGLRLDGVNANLAQVFEEDGKDFARAGIYVEVRDGVVALRKNGEEIVLQRGDSGFTDSGGGPLRKFGTPPPFIGRDPFLARSAVRGTGLGGSAGAGRMCGPMFGT